MNGKGGESSPGQSPPVAHVDPNGARQAALAGLFKNISSEQHVQVAVNDLVAYEYVDEKAHEWRWRLGTVAAIPGPRLVQVMLWTGGDEGTDLPPEQTPISPEARAAAMQRLKELREEKAHTSVVVEDLNKTLCARQANYQASRDEIHREFILAEETLREARVMVKSVQESDWREIRSYVSPPTIVELVLKATLATLGEKAVSWTEIRKVIRSNDFVKRITEFDPQKTSAATRRRLQKTYLSNPKFSYENAMNGSRALGALQRWVVAQMSIAGASGQLTQHDLERKDERDEIAEMQRRIAEFEKALERNASEEDELLAQIGDPVVHLHHTTSSLPSDAEASPHDSPLTVQVPAESVRGTGRPWTLTEQTALILRSSILVNYDAPKAKVLTLTEEQLQRLKDALQARAAPYAQECQAAAARKALENELMDARIAAAEDADALQRLKAAQNDLENELAAKGRALEDMQEAGAKQPGDDDKMASQAAEIDQLREQLADAERAVGDAQAALQAAQDGAKERDATGRRDLSAIIEALQMEIKRLRVQSADARDTVDGVNHIISSNDRLKAFMADAD